MFSSLVIPGLVALFAFVIYKCIYRLYLTPIAHIPGPALAKVTYGYEFYYDVIKKGRYTWKIAELHEKFGPIIRINPHEVHVADSRFADTIYLTTQTSRKIDKFPFAARAFGNDEAFFGTIPHEHHRIRRSPMNRFFTKQAIVQFEDVINHHVDRLMDFLREAKRNDEVVNMTNLFAGFTADVIAVYTLGEPLGVLDDKQYAKDWRALWMNFVSMSGVAKQVPYFNELLRSLPPWVTEKIDKNMAIINRWLASVEARLHERKAEYAESKSTSKVHYTLLDELLFGDMPAEERTISRIVDESQALLGAGSVTTAETLSNVSFHVLNDNKVLQRIQAELSPLLMQNPTTRPRWADLERLPYLTAVLRETLRHYYGVIQRSARVHRDADLTYGRYTIPRGTPVSTSAFVIHNDRAIYGEDADVWNPERWLIDDPQLLALRERSLITFGRGSRMCLGLQLAWAELYLVCAAIFDPRSSLNMKLFETDIENIRIKHDFVVGYPSLDSKGVQVTIES